MIINRLKIIHKIILMPLLAAVAFFIIFIIAQINIADNEDISKHIESGYFPAFEMSRDLRETLANIQRGLQDAVAATDEEKLNDTDKLRDIFADRLKQEKSNISLSNGELEGLELAFVDYYNLARNNAKLSC